MNRYKPFVFSEDLQDNLHKSIEAMQLSISRLRDQSEKDGMTLDAKQRIKNQINAIQNKITKKKDQLAGLSDKGK